MWMNTRIVLIGLIFLKMDMKNLIKISGLAKYKEVLTQVYNGSDNINIYKHTRVQKENEQAVAVQYSQRAPMKYNSNQLREISSNIKYNKQYKRVTHKTVINVRRLQLNKSRGGRKTRIWERKQRKTKTSVNLNNLIEIKVNITIDIRKYNRNFLI